MSRMESHVALRLAMTNKAGTDHGEVATDYMARANATGEIFRGFGGRSGGLRRCGLFFRRGRRPCRRGLLLGVVEEGGALAGVVENRTPKPQEVWMLSISARTSWLSPTRGGPKSGRRRRSRFLFGDEGAVGGGERVGEFGQREVQRFEPSGGRGRWQ